MQAKWTRDILSEMSRALRRNRPDITEEKASRQSLTAALDLPDPDDRHVLAAAIAVSAQVIVTRNRKDFPAKTLAQWNIRPKSPDDFVRDVIDLDPQAVWACVQQIVDSRTKRSPRLRRGRTTTVSHRMPVL